MILANGDEFMMPRNLERFIHVLKLQTNHVYIRFLDSGHDLSAQNDALASSIKSFLTLLSLGEGNLPEFNWKSLAKTNNGFIKFVSSNLNSFESYELKSYTAKTKDNKRIDFRKNTINGPQSVIWRKKILRKTLSNLTQNTYFHNIRPINKLYYTGIYLETSLKFIGQDLRFISSTNIHVFPDFYPVPDCEGIDCKGTLV